MHYYRNLYLYKNMRKKKKKVISRMEKGIYKPAVCLVVLPENPGEQLEIVDTIQMRQKDFPPQDFFVVGIAKDQGDALKMVAEIVEEVYNKTGGTDVRSYILNKEQEDA